MMIPLVLLISCLEPARGDDPPPVIPPRQITPITVRGKAVDAEGKPVAGATIRLLSVNGVYAVLGTTTTDEAGAYAFSDAPLSVRSNREGQATSGAFQVYGTAPGMGFAWHGMRLYYLRPRPPHLVGPEADLSRYFAGEPMTMDLTFTPAASLGGRVVDEAGRPMGGVGVQLVGAVPIAGAGKQPNDAYTSFKGVKLAPAALTTTTTDAEGRFRLAGLPRECLFPIRVETAGYAPIDLTAATATGSPPTFPDPRYPTTPDKPQRLVTTGDLALTLRKTRPVRFHIVAADTGQPVPGTRVWVDNPANNAASARGMIDATGHVSFPLAPDLYVVTISPPNTRMPTPTGKPYVWSEVEATVTSDPAEPTIELRLELGCHLTLEAVDAETGQGVPDVAFLAEVDGMPGTRVPVQEIAGYISLRPPKTDPAGRVRAVVYAGERAYSIGSTADLKYEAVVAEKRVTLPVGGDVTIRFELRKVR